MSLYTELVSTLVDRILDTVDQVQTEDITAMSVENLKQLVRFSGLPFANANVAHRAFMDALTEAQHGLNMREFRVYGGGL